MASVEDLHSASTQAEEVNCADASSSDEGPTKGPAVKKKKKRENGRCRK